MTTVTYPGKQAIQGKIKMMIQLCFGMGLVVSLLLGVSWLGLQVKPTAFSPVVANAEIARVAIDGDLPTPIQRYAEALYPDGIPSVQSALLQGRARLAPTGLPMQTRFRFYYDAPRSSYYHDIQATWFGLSVLRIHERLLEGHSRFDLSILGSIDDLPKTNRSAMQGYWAEVLAWVPAIALTDEHLQWELIDEHSVKLYLPESPAGDALMLYFDPETHLLTEIIAQRYCNEDDDEQLLWQNHILEWGMVDGWLIPTRSETQWEDDEPWAIWDIENIALNVDTLARFEQFGGDIP